MMLWRLQRIWFQTHLILGLPILHSLSPWTNNPHEIDPPGQTVPIKFVPYGQMVPNQFGPRISRSPQPFPPDNQNIPGTICPGEPFVHGDQIFGDHLSMGTELVGDRLSRGTNKLGTKFPGTICVWDQMCHSLWVSTLPTLSQNSPSKLVSSLDFL